MSVRSWIISSLGLAGNLARRIPGRVWLAVGCLLVAAFWMEQHDARIRQQARLQQLRQQTSAEVAALKKQAAQDMRQANVENAKAIQKLEARRRQLAQQNQKLAAQLDALRKQAEVQAEQVATLPISTVVTRVAAQLGLKAEDLATNQVVASGKSGKAQGKLRVANDESPKVGTDVKGRTADIPQGATTAPPAKVRGGRGALRAPAGGQSPPLQRPIAMALTGSGARRVERSLVELNACRAESKIENQQLANCRARAVAGDAANQTQARSIASLNRALKAKDTILSRQAAECKAELKAARATFLGRLAHVTEHLAIGVAVGVAVGVAIR